MHRIKKFYLKKKKIATEHYSDSLSHSSGPLSSEIRFLKLCNLPLSITLPRGSCERYILPFMWDLCPSQRKRREGCVSVCAPVEKKAGGDASFENLTSQSLEESFWLCSRSGPFSKWRWKNEFWPIRTRWSDFCFWVLRRVSDDCFDFV